MNYEQRIVAFIDILGFKSLLNDTLDKNGNDKEEKIDAVISAYNAIREIWDLDSVPQYLDVKIAETKKISIFSDCLVVSFAIE
ncbi:hypothetical protein Q4R36_09720, partial [Morganella morganii]